MDSNSGPPRPIPDPAHTHTETQDNLRQASAALEAAYQRIRQVRRSLLELTEMRPSIRSTPPLGLRPAHDSILLAGSSDSSERDLEMDGLWSEMDRLQQLEADLDSQYQTHRPSPPPLRPPPLPVSLPRPVAQIPPRRHWLEASISRRRTVNPEDPSTALGRRVVARQAAREAGGAVSPPVDTPLSPIDPSMPPLLGDYRIFQPSEIARNLENVNSRFLQRITRADLAFDRLHGPRNQQASGSRITAQTSPPVIPTPVATQYLPPRLNNPRRWRTLRAEARQNSGSPVIPSPVSETTRLSLLSNLSVQNLQTPTSAVSRDRPLLFSEEPSSYIHPSTLVRRHSEDRLDMNDSDRNYMVRRRINADGNEHVHNINLEWLDELESDSWDLTLPADRLNRARPYGPQDNLSPEPALRRRGWGKSSKPLLQVSKLSQLIKSLITARLDADGNEISSDEEYELEHMRAEERRLRQMYQARSSSQMEHESLIPVSRNPHGPEDDGGVARVRLNQRHQPSRRDFFDGAVADFTRFLDDSSRRRSERLDAVLSGGAQLPDLDPLPEVYGSDTPFVVNPLPMPLAEMVARPEKGVKKPVAGIRVTAYASLAGR